MEVSGTPHPAANRSQAAHGNHGRRVEYSIGWPVDEQTLAGIEQLRESDWGPAVHADGDVHLAAQVADLTGIMRTARCPRAGRVVPKRSPNRTHRPKAESAIRHSVVADRQSWLPCFSSPVVRWRAGLGDACRCWPPHDGSCTLCLKRANSASARSRRHPLGSIRPSGGDNVDDADQQRRI
jgi:hypothetical protein